MKFRRYSVVLTADHLSQAFGHMYMTSLLEIALQLI